MTSGIAVKPTILNWKELNQVMSLPMIIVEELKVRRTPRPERS